MKTLLIGVGQAGGKLTRELVDYDNRMGFGAVRGAVGVNTAAADLRDLPFETVLVGRDRVNGQGVGGDSELGADVMETHTREVLATLEGRITAGIESIFVVAGLGGGTGSGGAPVLARELARVYDVPVYGLGILPGRDEGSMYQVNAGRSLKTFAREADALVLVDNDAFRSVGESLTGGFDAINREVAKRAGLLLAAGETVEGVGESVVDSSEIINTLRSGGIAALGYAAAEAAPEAGENINTVVSTTRQAVLTGSSLPDATDADAALLIVAGDPDAVPRKGVERARKWVEEETGSLQVRGGDFPLSSGRLAAVVLLGGVERSERLQSFIDRASEAQQSEKSDESAADPAAEWASDDLDDLV
ncbi:cell division protein [Halobellus salinus]|uniref:Tubulin-like protein CetZ n=1 Tax=Halobellus salinus TaxID=931585 RepID=A0A830EEN2_9EURY|nr:tubulin/FtsZ family protein [Halobellus salinus]GGJ04666.1 cell division protein [Halobellus salinus]SMP09173.1 Cell division GTPase FtsZ [Halobellus salinus]